MNQIHKRFTDEQVKVLFQGYGQGKINRADIQEMLSIGKSRFFALLKEYRRDPGAFSVAYQRRTSARLPADVETEVKEALLREKEIVEYPDLPISGYNYSAIRESLVKKGIGVSVTTITIEPRNLGVTNLVGREKFMNEKCSRLLLVPWHNMIHPCTSGPLSLKRNGI